MPYTSSGATIKSAGVTNPYLNIILDINKQGVSVLLMGVVLDIVNTGTFTKAELIRTTHTTDVNTGVKEHRQIVDIVSSSVSHYKAVYLTGFEGIWRNTSKIEIRLSGYIGTENVTLLSVFGKIRGKESSFLTCAGGNVYGGMNVIGGNLMIEGNPLLFAAEFEKRPSSGLKNGYSFLCLDRSSPESKTNGIVLYFLDGKWIDALGRVVE